MARALHRSGRGGHRLTAGRSASRLSRKTEAASNSQGWMDSERSVGSRVRRGLDDPAWRAPCGVPARSSAHASCCGRMEPHADRPRHAQDRVEAWVAVLAERLVQALAAETGVLRDLAHADRAGDVAERA